MKTILAPRGMGVLPTSDMKCPLLQLMQLAGHCQAPQSSAAPLDPQQIIAAFQTECRDVRRGIDGDLTKVNSLRHFTQFY